LFFRFASFTFRFAPSLGSLQRLADSVPLSQSEPSISSSSSSSSGVVIWRRLFVEEQSAPPPALSDDDTNGEMDASKDEEVNGDVRVPKSILLDSLPHNGIEHVIRHLWRVPRAKTWTNYIST